MGVRRLKKTMQPKHCFSERKTQEPRVSYRSFGTHLPKRLQITCCSCKSQFVGLIFVQLVHWTLSSTFVCPVSFADGGVIWNKKMPQMTLRECLNHKCFVWFTFLPTRLAQGPLDYIFHCVMDLNHLALVPWY